MDFKIADIFKDSGLLSKVSQTVDALLTEDKDLAFQKHEGIKRYLEENTGNCYKF